MCFLARADGPLNHDAPSPHDQSGIRLAGNGLARMQKVKASPPTANSSVISLWVLVPQPLGFGCPWEHAGPKMTVVAWADQHQPTRYGAVVHRLLRSTVPSARAPGSAAPAAPGSMAWPLTRATHLESLLTTPHLWALLRGQCARKRTHVCLCSPTRQTSLGR